MNEPEYLMKNYGDLGGCHPPQATASLDNTLLDMIQMPNSIIVLLCIQDNFLLKNMAKTCLPPSNHRC